VQNFWNDPHVNRSNVPPAATPNSLKIQTNQPTIPRVYYLKFRYRSTCFGRPRAYYQKLNNCSSSLWFYRRSVVVAVLLVVVGSEYYQPCVLNSFVWLLALTESFAMWVSRTVFSGNKQSSLWMTNWMFISIIVPHYVSVRPSVCVSIGTFVPVFGMKTCSPGSF
jgi:hypothetical protein